MRVPLKLHGIIQDRPPSEVPPEFWTFAENMQVRDGQMILPAGSDPRLTDPGEPVHFLINTQGSSSWWVYASDTGIYQTDGSTAGNIATTGTPLGFTLGTWTADDVTGCLLNGLPYLLVGSNDPVHWAQTGNCVNSNTNWPGAAKSLWSFKNHLFAGDVNGNGDRVNWSDAIAPGTPTADWDTTTPSKNGGFVDLAETRGDVMNGLTLERSCMVYKTGSAYVAEFVGGNAIFAFRLLSREFGLLARHAVCDIDGAHLVLADGDIVLTDGRQAKSAIDGQLRRTLFGRLNPDAVRQCWAEFNREQREAWFALCLDGATIPNVAAIYDLQSGRWGLRDISFGTGVGLTNGARGVIQGSASGFTYATTTDLYNNTTYTYDTVFFAANQDGLMTAEQTAAADGQFTQQDVTLTTSPGGLISGKLWRYGIDLGEPDTIKTVRAVHINAQGSGTVQGRFGGRMTENGAVTWSDSQAIELDEGGQFTGLVSGRLIDVEFTFSDPVTVAGFAVEVASTAQH